MNIFTQLHKDGFFVLDENQAKEYLEDEFPAADPKTIRALMREWRRNADKPLTGGNEGTQETKKDGKGAVFVAAQNNTDPHPFFYSLVHYCEKKGYNLHVAPFVYNKNGFQNGVFDDDDIYYHHDILPYLSDERIKFGPVVFAADINILPTTKNPTSGFDGLVDCTTNTRAIIPSARLSARTLPSPKNMPARWLYSTGACTKRNYIQKKTGKLGEIRHTFSAIVVDRDNNIRQLVADESGGFYDLDPWPEYHSPQGEATAHETIAAYIPGDIHAEKLGGGSLGDSLEIAARLNPESIMFHDIIDFTSRNHHNRKNPLFIFQQGNQTVEDDIKAGSAVLDRFREKCPTSTLAVVKSNHDEALDKWLDETDYREDPLNAEFFLDMQLDRYRGDITEDILGHAMRKLGYTDTNTIFLDADESYTIHGVELGQHGHYGPNGARGNPASFANMGLPMVHGHTHSPAINWPVVTVGISARMDMGYNKGPSSWAHCDAVLYHNGTITLIEP